MGCYPGVFVRLAPDTGWYYTRTARIGAAAKVYGCDVLDFSPS